MTTPLLLCWIVVNATPYHAARLSVAARQIGYRLCLVQLTDMDDFPILQAQQGAADNFDRRTLCPSTPARQIVGRRLKSHLNACLDELRPSVVCVNGWSFGGGISALSWCLSQRVPVIMMSDSTEFDEPRSWWKEVIKRRVVRLCSASLVAGTLHRDYAIKLGVPPGSIFTGYDVVDNTHFQSGAIAARHMEKQLRKQLGLPLRYFMACSRFSRKKNLFGLLQAYARYREMCGGEAWSLVLIGEGELKDELIAQRETLGLQECVLFLGPKSYQELPTYYGLASAFVHASTTEQWGLVVNEAMAAGLPVLVSNRCGCAVDLVAPGINGFVFDPHNVDELAGAMTEISRDSCDRKAMGRASEEIVARWSPEQFAAGLGRAAEAAIRATRPGPSVLDWLVLKILDRR